MVRDLLVVGLVPRPTFTESGLGCAALVSESRHQVAGHSVRGASQPCRLVGSLGRAVPHPPGSRRRAPWSESGVRSGQFGNRCRRRCGGAPGGAEQADAADEGRSEAGGIIVVGHSTSGCHRGRGQGRAPLAADPRCSTPLRGEHEAEAVPGVDTARRFGIGRTGCAAPNVQTAVAGYVGLGVYGSGSASFRLGPAADLH